MSSVLRRSGFRSAVERAAVGDTKTSMVRVDHLGWLVCDGRELLKTEYRALYAVIGDDFGIAASGYFRLPDAQGRVVGLINTGPYANPDLSGWTDGGVSGEEMHTLTIAELPAHNHDISGGYLNVSGGVDPSGNGNTSENGTHFHTGTTDGAGYNTNTYNALIGTDAVQNNEGTHTHTFTTNTAGAHRHQIASNGGSLPHNNMQPTLFMGNLFIYCGQPGKNITGPDGVTPIVPGPSSYPSFYPPSDIPGNRLY